MIKLSAAALSYAQRPGFKALLFSDVKAPAEGAQSPGLTGAKGAGDLSGARLLRSAENSVPKTQ